MSSCAAFRRVFVLLPLVLVCAFQMFAQVTSDLKFAYSGDEGPGFWGSIAKACEATPSAHQSPVDIRDASVALELQPLDLILAESSFKLINNGYTVSAEPLNPSSLSLDGVSFALKNFHFHTLSEHTLAGGHFAMEAHFVFQYGDTKRRAVIGVLYEIGEANSFIEKLIRTGLPPKHDSPARLTPPLNIEQAFTDTAHYYTYPGSLTVPPCDEEVTWFVLTKRDHLSRKQFESFRNILGNDFRPVQDLHGRVIQRTANAPE